MINKDIQQIKIGVLEVLLASCKDEPSSMYEQAQKYLQILQNSLEEHTEFFQQEYKGQC